MIRHDWFLSYRQNSQVGQVVRKDVFDHGQNALIQMLIEKYPPIIATLEDVPEEAVAWMCRAYKTPVVHFVYVKFAYRRKGIASLLVDGVKQYTHQTKVGDALFRKHGALFNPYLLQGMPCLPLPA